MLRLKLQYFGHLMRTVDSQEKSLLLGKTEGGRRGGHQRMRWLDGITEAMDMNLGEPQKMVRDREAWRAAVHGVTKSQTHWATEQQEQSPVHKATQQEDRCSPGYSYLLSSL